MKLKEIRDQFPSGDAFLKAVHKEVIKLAAEQPTYRYCYTGNMACKYNGPAAPLHYLDHVNPRPDETTCDINAKGCIFGVALQRMGWADTEELNTLALIKDLMMELLDDNFVYEEHRIQLDALQRIQNKQDAGMTWGEAVDPSVEIRHN